MTHVQAYQLAEIQGGITLEVVNHKEVKEIDSSNVLGRYVVALRRNSVKISSVSNEGMTIEVLKAVSYQAYLEHSDIGMWFHGASLYVEHVMIVEDLESAKHIAKNNGQLAIYDLVDKKEIEMPLKSLND